VLVEILALYGHVLSDVHEDVFNDGLDGTNRTGIYSVMMKLHKELPQLVPLYGKCVKLYFKGIQNCVQIVSGLITNRSANQEKRNG
jgi:hypothetical protein